MIEKNDATSPARASTLTSVASPSLPVSLRASTNGTALLPIASAPAAPASRKTTSTAVNIRNSMAPMMPRGTSRAGLRDSSAASGTPSTARNSHMPKGSAAQMPYQPLGMKSLAPQASVGAISNRRLLSKSPISATAVAMIANTARPLITIITLSASPTPAR